MKHRSNRNIEMNPLQPDSEASHVVRMMRNHFLALQNKLIVMKPFFALAFVVLLGVAQAQQEFTLTFEQGRSWDKPTIMRNGDSIPEWRLKSRLLPLRLSSQDMVKVIVRHDTSYDAKVTVNFRELKLDSAQLKNISISGDVGSNSEDSQAEQQPPAPARILSETGNTMKMVGEFFSSYPEEDSKRRAVALDSLGSPIHDYLQECFGLTVKDTTLIGQVIDIMDGVKDKKLVADIVHALVEEKRVASVYAFPMDDVSQGGLWVSVTLEGKRDTLRNSIWLLGMKDWNPHSAMTVALNNPRSAIYSLNVDSSSYSIDSRTMSHAPTIGQGVVFEQVGRRLTSGVYLGFNYALDDEEQASRLSASAGLMLRLSGLRHVGFTAGVTLGQIRKLDSDYAIGEDYAVSAPSDVPTLDDVLIKDYQMGLQFGLILQNISR